MGVAWRGQKAEGEEPSTRNVALTMILAGRPAFFSFSPADATCSAS